MDNFSYFPFEQSILHSSVFCPGLFLCVSMTHGPQMSLSFAVWLFNFLGERAPFYLQPLGLLEQSVHFPHLSESPRRCQTRRLRSSGRRNVLGLGSPIDFLSPMSSSIDLCSLLAVVVVIRVIWLFGEYGLVG